MTTFFMEVAIGGKYFVKVEAPDLDKAQEIAAIQAIDDWESAGALKLGDVDVRESTPDSYRDFGASIKWTEAGYEYAKDDPRERGN